MVYDDNRARDQRDISALLDDQTDTSWRSPRMLRNMEPTVSYLGSMPAKAAEFCCSAQSLRRSGSIQGKLRIKRARDLEMLVENNHCQR